MSVILHTTLDGPTIRIYVRSDSTATTLVVRENNSAGANAVATLGKPIEGLRRLGLNRAANYLESRARDWRFLSMAELSAALQMKSDDVEFLS